MTDMLFWGQRGEYGPFTSQIDGWPNAGEVLRYYRRTLYMGANELAKRYSESIGESVTARWILKMEQQNKVPKDITRRRILAEILHIPPLLLGLASLEDLTSNTLVESEKHHVPYVLKNFTIADIAKYNQHARNSWLLSYAGQEDLQEVVNNIRELERLESQSRGELQKFIRQCLNSYYQLASDITRHQGNFITAWHYANLAVQTTRHIDINDFVSAALYRRGYTSLERGFFGDKTVQGLMNHQPDRKYVEAAVTDFEEALLHARPQLKGAIWLELSRAQGILCNTSVALRLSEMAQREVGITSSMSDPMEQILLEGALNGLNEGMYLLGKAASLIITGRTTTAVDILDDLEDLKSGRGIARNQTRRLAYADMLRAEASLGTKDYIMASTRAISAFEIFRDINTIEKLAWINDIYRRLSQKYSNNAEVKRLGDMISTHHFDKAEK